MPFLCLESIKMTELKQSEKYICHQSKDEPHYFGVIRSKNGLILHDCNIGYAVEIPVTNIKNLVSEFHNITIFKFSETMPDQNIAYEVKGEANRIDYESFVTPNKNCSCGGSLIKNKSTIADLFGFHGCKKVGNFQNINSR